MATVQMQMSERGVRQFGSALVFLSKNGKDITLEATVDGVVLRTLNDAKNAFAAVHFHREFFDDFRPPDVTQKSKFMAKCAIQAFRTVKGVESLRIYFAEQNHTHFLVFQFKSKHDVTRTHSMLYEDTEVLSPTFTRADSPHHCICRPGLLSRLIGHIMESDDVSFIVTPHKLEFRTFFPQKAEDNTVRGHLLTAMSISPLEFDRFHLGPPEPREDGAVDAEVHTDVTFSLKALRSLLAFAEEKSVCSEEVAIFFGPTANPVGVSTEGVLARPFRAELVLATLQRSVVEESALPHPGAKASASGETAPPALASGKLFSVAAAPPPVAPPHPEHGPSASGAAEPPLDAPARRAAPQFMTQNSTERRDAGLPAVSVARRPSNISLLDDDAPAGAMLEEDPDSVLLDGAGGVRDSHSDALGRGRPGGGREAPRSHSGTRAAPGGPSAVAVATARVPQAPPISLTQLPAAPPGESQEF